MKKEKKEEVNASRVHNEFLTATEKMVGQDKAVGRSRRAGAGNAPLIPAYETSCLYRAPLPIICYAPMPACDCNSTSANGKSTLC